jgi:tetratricopeptide (TPR) repeat protein
VALSIEPSQAAFSVRGDAYLGLKEYDRAIESFAEARRIDPAVAEAYYRKSQILQTSGNADQAAESLRNALALDPDVEDRLR